MLALLLWALHPMMLGYGALMAVDTAHASVVSLALFLTWRYYQTPGVTRLILTGLAMGASMATKYLAILFLPAIALFLCVGTWRASRASTFRRGLQAAGTCVAAGLIALVALHACYGFRTGCAPRESAEYSSALLQGLAPMPLLGSLIGLMPRAFMEGIDYQSSIASDVITTYFNGRFARGHNAYYAGALAWKSPEVHLFSLRRRCSS